MAFDYSLIEAPFRMQPGLRRVAPGTPQLTPAHADSRHRREKMAVLAAFADEALVALPGFDAAPALRAIYDEVARLHLPPAPHDADTRALIAGLPERQRPAARLSLAFEEDFAVIDAATATIPWLAVCLPSRWDPSAKLGLHFAAVHAPVADNALLVAAGESLARLVSGPGRWERFVWTVTAEPRLHQHPSRDAATWPDGDAEMVAAAAFFRSERQTFIPVAGHGQAVFTIRVDSLPLRDAVGAFGAARRLHDAIASMSPAVLDYRGLADVRERLLVWLRQRADAEAATTSGG
ncbi:MAG: heme-dependent oxidative N-demethylase subunit alpha family protein [Caldimonas sp.]